MYIQRKKKIKNGSDDGKKFELLCHCRVIIIDSCFKKENTMDYTKEKEKLIKNTLPIFSQYLVI